MLMSPKFQITANELLRSSLFRSDVLAYAMWNPELQSANMTVLESLSEFIWIQRKVGGDLMTVIQGVLGFGRAAHMRESKMHDLHLFLLKAQMHEMLKSIPAIEAVYKNYGLRSTQFTIRDYGSYAGILGLTVVIDIARLLNTMDDENTRHGNRIETDPDIERAYEFVLDRFTLEHAEAFVGMIHAFGLRVAADRAPLFSATYTRLGFTA